MLWLYITTLSYLLFALSSLADRYLLKGPLQHPRAYTFYIGITGILVTFFVPFGFNVPDVKIIFLSFLTGVLSIVALYFFYKAIFYGFVSTAVPAIGALAPMFTLFFSAVIKYEQIVLTSRSILAFLFIILGTVFLSLNIKKQKLIFSRRNILNIILTAALFGLGFVLTRLVYENQGFLNGFIWMRWGGFLGAASLLLFPKTRKIIFQKNPIKQKRVWAPILFGKGAGAAGFGLQQYAISIVNLTQVTFINALGGIQHFFILLFSFLVSLKNPKLLKEQFTKSSIALRIGGILCIVLGLWFLAL